MVFSVSVVDFDFRTGAELDREVVNEDDDEFFVTVVFFFSSERIFLEFVVGCFLILLLFIIGSLSNVSDSDVLEDGFIILFFRREVAD
jgi:hypothetical protein